MARKHGDAGEVIQPKGKAASDDDDISVKQDKPMEPEDTVPAADDAREDAPDVDLTDDSPEPDTSDDAAESSETDEAEAATADPDEPDPDTSKKNLWQRFCGWISAHKKASVVLGAVLLLGVLAAVPATRYALAGLVMKEDFTVTVLDAQGGKPVSGADVALGSKTAKTDGKGTATFHVPVGNATVTMGKKYYRAASQKVLVPLFKKGSLTLRVTATGRQVPVTVVNKISGAAISGATIKAAGTDATTDKNGKATLVVPAGQETVEATISAKGYNALKAKVQVTTDEVAANKFNLVPAGKLYFLSNASGTIDVVKADLDGSNRAVVLKGTGKEDKFSTSLLASRDWRYLALLSLRDGGEYAKLFLIDTDTDKVTTMDEGAAQFTPTGWFNDTFVYQVDRTNVKNWQPKKQALKSYDAVNKKIAILDETTGIGDSDSKYLREYMGPGYEVNGEVVVAKSLSMGGYGLSENLHKSTATVIGVKPDGSGKHTIKSFAPSSAADVDAVSVSINLYKPGELYILYSPQYNDSKGAEEWEYEDGKTKQVDVDTNKFYQTYLTYLQSPDGTQTLWGDSRDGKVTSFVGDKSGGNQKEVLSVSEYQPYGWFTSDYYLFSKNGSELYIMPAKSEVKVQPIKLTDYYKPAATYPGYGGGYGGV